MTVVELACVCTTFTGHDAMGWTRRAADGLWVHAGCGHPSAATLKSTTSEKETPCTH